MGQSAIASCRRWSLIGINVELYDIKGSGVRLRKFIMLVGWYISVVMFKVFVLTSTYVWVRFLKVVYPFN